MLAPFAIPNQDNLLVLSAYFGVPVDSLVSYYKTGNISCLPLQVMERLNFLRIIDLSVLKLELGFMPALEDLCSAVSGYLKMSKILYEKK